MRFLSFQLPYIPKMPHKIPKKKYDPRGDPFGGHHVGKPQYPIGQGKPRPLIGTEALGSGARQAASAREGHEALEREMQKLNREVQERSSQMNLPPTEEQLRRAAMIRRRQQAARELM
jgi:hypothetical protein